MQVFFCDQCSRRVTEGELAVKDGARVGDLVFCRFCAEQPGVQELIERESAVQAAQARGSGFHRAVGRRTPRRGHTRIGLEVASGRRGAKTPSRGRRPTPRPVRPVSPISSPAATVEAAGAPHRGAYRSKKAPSSSAAQHVLVGLVGIAAGFIIVAAASTLTARPPAKPRGREIQVRWERGDAARFRGECTVEHVTGRLVVLFPNRGRWTVHANEKVAYHGVVDLGAKGKPRPVKLGPAGRWLEPGVNGIVATREGGAAQGPPRLLLE